MARNNRKARREMPVELGITASAARRAEAFQRIDTDEHLQISQSGISQAAKPLTAGVAYLRNPSHWWVIGLIALLALGTFGAGIKYLEESAQRQKAERATPINNSNGESQNWLNAVNPFVEPPLPTATPQLSKEYIYAGSRMLAVEDANASAVPPADLAVWRPSSGYWYVLGGPGSQQTAAQWGAPTDKTVPGDYDGDGKTDFSVFRPSEGNWYIIRSSNSTWYQYQFGQLGDKVAPADYDGDGRTDAAVFRPSNGNWYIQQSSAGFTSLVYGYSTDIPAAADYDGDGKADLAVWRNDDQTFYYKSSSDGQLRSHALGQSGEPVSADYDGDGKVDAAVKNGNNWIIKQSSNGQTVTIPWQTNHTPTDDIAVQNDYDGDGKVDIAVWHKTDGYWFIRNSTNPSQPRVVQWGAPGDVPVPAFYRR